MTGQFTGKYRGVVTDVQDPLNTMRIKARVPDVFAADESGWALPCAPFGGDRAGFFALPTVGAGVWIEFEHGDSRYPIWSGTWWGSAKEVPPALLTPPYQKTAIVTPGGHSVTIDDTPGTGGITLETASGARITMTQTGIEITNGTGATIALSGPRVTVNDGALEVT